MINKKKIIFLNIIPSPYRVDFFNELDKVCDLLVIYYYPLTKNSRWADSGKAQHYKHVNLFENQKQSIVGTLKLIKLLHKNKNEIIVVGGYAELAEMISIFYLKLFGVRFVLNSDGGFVTRGFFKTFLKKILIKSASYWLSSGINTSKTLKYYGAKSAFIYEYSFTSLLKTEILKNNLEIKQLGNLKSALNLKQHTFYLVFVGQLIYRKGVDILLESLTLTADKDIEILIIGEGDQSENLKEYCYENGIYERVHFLGKLPKKEVLGYLKVSDAFVFPSREDIWGLVLNEAIACGLPVISSKHVGSAYSLINEGKNGNLVKNNSSDWAKAIDEITKKDSVKMRKESLEIAKKYSIEQMMKDHMILFSKLGA